MTTTTCTSYPLLFTFLHKVEGNGYLAEIKVHGRLLAVQEEDCWWMYGVNPGALAASGPSRAEAYMEFRKTLMEVLFDLASESDSFYEFSAAAKAFFHETDPDSIAEWEAARELVRAGKVTIEGMTRETSESPRRIEVTKKQDFTAKDNAVDPNMAMAA